jgi:hypothetical protein
MNMVGADICGFSGSTTVELCSRWAALGAFYPFMRNHNIYEHDGEGAAQEFYAMGSQVLDIARKYLRIRYRLLPFLYSASQNYKVGCLAAPLWMHYSEDEETWPLDEQFLLGRDLLVVPVLTEGATSVRGYLPGADERWYDFYTGALVVANTDAETTTPTAWWHTFDAPVDHLPVFVRGGAIIFQQDAELTSWKSRRTPFTIIAAFSSAGGADVTMIQDDGETVDGPQRTFFPSCSTRQWEARSRRCEFGIVSNDANADTSGVMIKSFVLYGAASFPGDTVFVPDMSSIVLKHSMHYNEYQYVHFDADDSVTYNAATDVLRIALGPQHYISQDSSFVTLEYNVLIKSDDDNGNAHKGLIIGIVVGLVVLLLGIVAYVCWRRRKHAQQPFGVLQADESGVGADVVSNDSSSSSNNHAYEEFLDG